MEHKYAQHENCPKLSYETLNSNPRITGMAQAFRAQLYIYHSHFFEVQNKTRTSNIEVIPGVLRSFVLRRR